MSLSVVQQLHTCSCLLPMECQACILYTSTASGGSFSRTWA